MDWIVVTTHAAQRWHERTTSPGVGPIVAWNDARCITVPSLQADEIRYHAPTNTLLLGKNNALVTVIDVGTAYPDVREAVHSN